MHGMLFQIKIWRNLLGTNWSLRKALMVKLEIDIKVEVFCLAYSNCWLNLGHFHPFSLYIYTFKSLTSSASYSLKVLMIT